MSQPTIKTWSYSRLSVFEQCKFRAKLAYIDRIPEPPRELPPGKTEHANDRGTRVHEGAELYVKNEQRVELLPELRKFQPEFEKLRELYKQGKVSLEGEWAVDRLWRPVGWNSPDAWARMKLDAFVRLSPTRAVVIDFKTGKKFGNEVKHGEQGQLYQLSCFVRYPELEHIDVEFWYTDQDDLTRVSYSRNTGMRYQPSFERRGATITESTDFPPNPNAFSCRWCPYGPKGTGHCDKGVQ